MSAELLDRPIAFHRAFVTLTGSVTAALMLSQAVYWQRRSKDGWWWKTQEEWQDETGLSRREQDTARKALRELGFWHEKRSGVPAKLFFSLDMVSLQADLAFKIGGKRQTGLAENANQDGPNPPISLTETTSETTSTDTETSPSARESASRVAIVKNFEEFWLAYPRRTGKGAALRAWLKIGPSGPTRAMTNAIITAVQAQSVPGAQLDPETRRAQDGRSLVPHPATWLNQKRWLDDVEAPTPKEGGAGGRAWAAEMAAKERAGLL